MIEQPKFYSDELSALFHQLAKAHKEAEKSLATLNKITNGNTSLPWVEKLIESTIHYWLKKHLSAISAAYQGNTRESLSLSALHSRFFNLYELAPGLHHNKYSLQEAINKVIECYDFDGLVEHLYELANGLEDLGLTNAASILAKHFNIRAVNHQWYEPKRTQRRYVFCHNLFGRYNLGYSFEFKNMLRELFTVLLVVEKEMGVAGLSSSMENIYSQFNATREEFPSRTTLEKGSPIEMVVFKEHVNFNIKPDAADAILAFIRINSEIELYDFNEQAA